MDSSLIFSKSIYFSILQIFHQNGSRTDSAALAYHSARHQRNIHSNLGILADNNAQRLQARPYSSQFVFSPFFSLLTCALISSLSKRALAVTVPAPARQPESSIESPK